MREVALIVFDECHHCKKQTPYNCIMNEFYFETALRVSHHHAPSLSARDDIKCEACL